MPCAGALLVLFLATLLPGQADSLRSLQQHQALHPGDRLRLNISWDGLEFLTPSSSLDLGLVQRGDLSRLRGALTRLQRGKDLKLAAVGGSITAGQGKHDAYSWPQWLTLWVEKHFQAAPNGTRDGWGKVHVLNSAVPGTTSQYMSLCVNIHVPQDVDIVVLEYALNDIVTDNRPPYQNPLRRGYERLVRQLLRYPRRPAVVLLHAFRWFHTDGTPNGTFWQGNAERDLNEIAAYYELPVLSVRSCCYSLMLQGVRGFNVSMTRGNPYHRRPEPEDVQIRDDMFYWDMIHPNGRAGHKVMAELVAGLLMTTEQSLVSRAATEEELQQTETDLRPPMIGGNYETLGDRCLVEDALRSIGSPVLPDEANTTQFKWMNDRPAGRMPKYGWVASAPGAVMNVTLDTRVSTQKAGSSSLTDAHHTLVALGFLTSYQNMGSAKVRCAANCICRPAHFSFLTQVRASLTTLFELVVTQHEQCVLQITSAGTVDEEGVSVMSVMSVAGTAAGDGGSGAVMQKVKLMSVMVCDEQPELANGSLRSFAATDYVINAAKHARKVRPTQAQGLT